MKRITAIAVTAAAIIGCSYVGGAGADTEITSRTTCAQVWGMSELPYTEAFEEISRTNPQMTNEVRDTQIALCESSKAVALSGGSLPDVIAVISSKSSELPEELRKQMLFMSVAGWSIGNKVR